MSWKSGSRIMGEIIEAALDTITDESERHDLYMQLIDIFEDNDCDTLYECVDANADPVFNDAYGEMHPDDDPILEDDEIDEDWDDQSNGSF